MKTVAVHSGKFHADEVFAVAILKLLHPKLEVIRTRNPEEYDAADLRVDVCGRYNPEKGDYDHHQPEGAGKRANGIPYSSAGLIWKHFGKELVNSREAWQKIDDKIIQPIDAVDNGIDTFKPILLMPYTISSVINVFNPNWKDKSSFDESFKEAVRFATEIIKKEIHRADSIKEAEKIVLESIKESPKEYIILKKFCPWKHTIMERTKNTTKTRQPRRTRTTRIHKKPTNTSQQNNTKKTKRMDKRQKRTRKKTSK